MILIVEGSNQTGKTDFTNKLKECLENCEINVTTSNFMENNTIDAIDEFIEALKNDLENKDKFNVFIFDSFYLSAIVNKKIGFEEFWKLDQFISEIPFVEQLFLASTFSHIEDKADNLEYQEKQYKMLMEVMKCSSVFSVEFIDSKEDVDALALNYAYKMRKQFGPIN